jgi:hypothetical protein
MIWVDVSLLWLYWGILLVIGWVKAIVSVVGVMEGGYGRWAKRVGGGRRWWAWKIII